MTEQQQATGVNVNKQGQWVSDKSNPQFERANYWLLINDPEVPTKVKEEFTSLLGKLKSGEIQPREGKTWPTGTFAYEGFQYGMTKMRDNNGLEDYRVWRRPESGSGGGGGRQKIYYKLTGFKTGTEPELNQWIASHPDENYEIVPLTFADFQSGVQRFMISSKKPIFPQQPQQQDQSSQTNGQTKQT